jgi:hypothetical protein
MAEKPPPDSKSPPGEILSGGPASARGAVAVAALDHQVPAKPKRDTIDKRIHTFIRALLASKDAIEAATEASYSPASARGLLRREDVKAAVSAERRARQRALRHTPAQIEARLGDLAFSDVANLFNDDLTLKPLTEIAPEDRAAIAGIDVQEFHDETGRVVRRVHKIRLERKQPALETIGQMHGLISPTAEGPAASLFEIHFRLGEKQWDVQAEERRLELARLAATTNPAIDVTPTKSPPVRDPDPNLN